MTLSELSGEYLKEEEKLTRQIKSFTPEIHRLTGEDLYLARRRLMCLYEMRSDVRAVARTTTRVICGVFTANIDNIFCRTVG